MPQKANNRTSSDMTVKAPSPAAPVGVPVILENSLRHAVPAGSRILTARGEALVETIKVGDRVITRDRGMVVVRDIVRSVAARGAPMVSVPANAMGQGRPERDLTLPPDQPIVLRDWRARTIFGAKEARVAMARLVDGSIIRTVKVKGGAVYSLVLDQPCALYVDGLELVSGALDAIAPRTGVTGA